MAQRAGVFDGWTFDKSVNLPLLAMAVGSLVTGSMWVAKFDQRMARNEEKISRIETALDKLASYQRSVDRLEVRVGTNERNIATLQEDVKAIR